MKKQIVFFLALSLSASLLQAQDAVSFVQAQDARELIRENPLRLGSIHHRYEIPDIEDTPAPRGYKPFYISHYGRHGCRYHAGQNHIDKVMNAFDSIAAHNLFTPLGNQFYQECLRFESHNEDMIGYLTQRGAADHKGIASRMYRRYPRVFNQKERKEVLAYSSIYTRCVQSMSNFLMELKTSSPDLVIKMYTGERFLPKTLNQSKISNNPQIIKAIEDSLFNSTIDTSRIMKEWFTDAEAAASFFGYPAPEFIYYVYFFGTIEQCLDEEDTDIYSYFTEDELYSLWNIQNIISYDHYAITAENGGLRSKANTPILKDIVDCADEAVAGNGKAADFRFGHDSGLMPLIALLGLEGNGVFPMAEATRRGWYCWEQMPMASNLQLVFFKNTKGDVLVKILRNEKETSIPALKSFSGSYYKWDELREYFVSLL